MFFLAHSKSFIFSYPSIAYYLHQILNTQLSGFVEKRSALFFPIPRPIHNISKFH